MSGADGAAAHPARAKAGSTRSRRPAIADTMVTAANRWRKLFNMIDSGSSVQTPI
jgi:hypothetical protein